MSYSSGSSSFDQPTDDRIRNWKAAGEAMRSVVKQTKDGDLSAALRRHVCKRIRQRKSESTKMPIRSTTESHRVGSNPHFGAHMQKAKSTDSKPPPKGLQAVRERINQITGHILPKAKKSAKHLRKSFAMRRTRSLGTEEEISISSDAEPVPRSQFRPRKIRNKSKKPSVNLTPPRAKPNRSPQRERSPQSRINILKRNLLSGSKSQPMSAISNRRKLKLVGTQSLDLHDSMIPNIEDVFSSDSKPNSGNSSTSLDDLLPVDEYMTKKPTFSATSGVNIVSHNSKKAHVAHHQTSEGSFKKRGLYLRETDSIPNLADIESSNNSEDEKEEESQHLADRVAKIKQKKKVDNKGHLEKVDEHRGVSPPDNNFRSDASSDLEPQDEEDRDLERMLSELVVPSSHSDHDKDVSLGSQGIPEANSSPSDQDAEADDEFECDCLVCQQNKRIVNEGGDNVSVMSLEICEVAGSDPAARGQYNISDVSDLELLLNAENTVDVLTNVLTQMVMVYPDLLGDSAPPPASPDTISHLREVVFDEERLVNAGQCAVCLCPFELGEEAKLLPCQHLFHSLCVHLWLQKSGTCPVCRFIL